MLWTFGQNPWTDMDSRFWDPPTCEVYVGHAMHVLLANVVHVLDH